MEALQYFEAWQDSVHADSFDGWSRLSIKELKKIYESFNEIRLFLEKQSLIRGKDFVEVGCATGELYRYLRYYFPRFKYYGFDISQPAINRAKQKYPEGNFFVCNEEVSDIERSCTSPSVLFARDVVIHQVVPFDFLARLITIPKEAAILRIRTRDKGETILDPEISCQLHCEKWIPYMILNVDEVIETITKTRNCKVVTMVKNYKQLGGWDNRFLPKECYFAETGTAETAVYIEFTEDAIRNPTILICERLDSDPKYSVYERVARILRNRIMRRLR